MGTEGQRCELYSHFKIDACDRGLNYVTWGERKDGAPDKSRHPKITIWEMQRRTRVRRSEPDPGQRLAVIGSNKERIPDGSLW